MQTIGQSSNNTIDFLNCPAKTYTDNSGKIRLGRNVLEHCLIVGHVADALLNRLPLSPAVRNLFTEHSKLIAALHDIGKNSPTFYLRLLIAAGINWQEQHPELLTSKLITLYCKAKDSNYLAYELTEMEHEWGGHAGLGAIVLREIQNNKHSKIAGIVGRHHGMNPPEKVKRLNNGNSKFGGELWQAGRLQLIEEIQRSLNTFLPLSEELTRIQEDVISGLVCVADWIGSGSRFNDPATDWRSQIETALDDAGYIKFRLKENLTFSQLFGFAPRETQSKLIEVCNQPGVYILEAPMGIGKTEAALYAAYQCMVQGSASGFYFALPTQLTSNKIHERVESFLKQILSEDVPGRALLLHSNARFMEIIQKTEVGEEGQPGASWFNQAKRGLLAPFAVGTLDQALLAAMNVRHCFVRAFGLLGKVVILDEIHSYDDYTSGLLDKLLPLLREMHCTVIILSATLTQSRCANLLKIKNNNSIPPSETNKISDTAPYPLISASIAGQPVRHIPVTPPSTQKVHIHLSADNEAAMDEALLRAAQGQQVLWIENTVKDAQLLYQVLAARCAEMDVKIPCGLLHSRFLPEHRAENEQLWVNTLGKAGYPERSNSGRLIIGTQVVEQSLDIDADFIISRFAPMDMLFQRLGRLWRHQYTPRPVSARCEAWLLAPTLDAAINNPPTAFGLSAYVYSPYVLCRSLQTLQHRLERSQDLQLPDDIRPLIDATYNEQDHTNQQDEKQRKLAKLYHDLQGKRQKLTQLALHATAQAGQTQSDKAPGTRYSEDDTADILIFKNITTDSNRRVTILELFNGEKQELPWNKSALTAQQWRRLSYTIMNQVVHYRQSKLTGSLALRKDCNKLKLGHVLYLGSDNYETAPFALALLNEISGDLRWFGQEQNSTAFRYHRDLGLLCVTDKDRKS